MKPSIYHRIRRRTASHEAATAKKDNKQEQSFFGESAHETFFQPSPVIQRKCENCEEDDKKVQRQPEKKEEEKQLQKKEDLSAVALAKEEKKEEEKVQRQPEKKEEEKIQKAEDNKGEDEIVQKKEAGTSFTPSKSVSSYIGSLNGKGQSLSPQTNHFFSSKMDYDFSNVKVHTDKEAAQSAKDVNAKAYTLGNHIVFNEGQYNTESSEGKRLMAHELTHVVQQKKNKKELQRQKGIAAGWTTIVKDAFAAKDMGKQDIAETKFAEALQLIGYNASIARGGRADASKLSPGLNFDLLHLDAAGTSGFIVGNLLSAKLPFTDTEPVYAEVVGPYCFQSANSPYTTSVVEHEFEHTAHHKNSWALFKKWKTKGGKAEEKKLKSEITRYEKIASGMSPDDIERGKRDITASQMRAWLLKKKTKASDVELTYESASTMRTKHWDSEVLAGLKGFMKAFPLIPVTKGVADADIFYTLTGYPVGDGFWAGVDAGVKAEYYNKIRNFYFKEIDTDHQAALNEHLKVYSSRKWRDQKNADTFFAMIRKAITK